MTDSDEARRLFAVERSHRDSDVSADILKAAGQAAILINGGAATAILAYLAKDKLDPSVLEYIPWGMIVYAFGVSVGAGMLFCAARALELYNESWRLTAHPEGKRNSTKVRKLAFGWLIAAHGCFYISMATFLAGSVFVALTLKQSIPPQQIPEAPKVQTSPGP